MRAALAKYGGRFSGVLAFGIQRVTGLLLLGYLFLHIRTIYALHAGPAAFDRELAGFRSLPFKLLEIGLFGAVVLHALNGIRITLVDLGLQAERRLFWVLTVGVGSALFLAGAVPLFLDSVLRR